MKKIKKYGWLLLVLLLVFAAACDNDTVEGADISDTQEDVNTNGDDTSTNPDGNNQPTTPENNDTPVTPEVPDEPTVETWRESVTDSGYSGAKLIRKVGDKTVEQALGESFADEISYIATLKDPKQSNGPASYTDYKAFSIAFDDPSGNNYGIDFVYVTKNGKTYLAVKEDKENTYWLTANAVLFFEDMIKANNITL